MRIKYWINEFHPPHNVSIIFLDVGQQLEVIKRLKQSGSGALLHYRWLIHSLDQGFAFHIFILDTKHQHLYTNMHHLILMEVCLD
jgi:hypothetical protein